MRVVLTKQGVAVVVMAVVMGRRGTFLLGFVASLVIVA
jgi:hypothetical protein